ncbi:MAG: UpxY family transcription antiterminator [Tannerellaceae bacterium]|jgi:transcription antitermination factor NusG|nr:UpxY family transcription antiterminator [Tannerellaceae bacterium]
MTENEHYNDNENRHIYWFVLYTLPRAEKQVAKRINQQEFECWLPLHLCPRAWSDRVKTVEVPLFHSYVFVKCLENQLHTLLRIYGVSRIVYYNGKPAVVRQQEIDAIHDFLQQSANHPLLVGDEAEILVGAMKHVSGKVTMINKNYIVLYLEQLGATVITNLDHVAPVNRLK